MALFDSIVSDLAGRFGLGNKAAPLLSALMSLITGSGGGLTGFIDKFRNAGLGDQVASWISGTNKMPLTETQLERALGGETIGKIASQSGLSLEKVKPALAFLIPSVIDKLTPSGVIPTSLPSLGSLISGVTGAAGAAVGAAGAGVSHAASAATEAAAAGGSGLLKFLPLLLLVGLGFLGYQYCNRPVTPTQTVATTPVPVATPIPINSSLSLVNADGKVKVTGVVPDEASKQKILDELKATYGEGKYEANITVNPAAKPAGWLAKLGDVLKEFKIPGAELSFDGDAIKVGGAAAAVALVDKLKGLFGSGFNVMSSFLDVGAAVKAANEKASAALAALTGGASAVDVAKALNLQIINFASGKADIPKENQEILKKAAETIKAAAAGAKLEVSGHTDNKGAAAGNLKLSQSRADAVKAFLVKQGVKAEVLVAKGYGPDKPVASNDTDEGRFKNRRIEFAAVN